MQMGGWSFCVEGGREPLEAGTMLVRVWKGSDGLEEWSGGLALAS